MTTNAPSTYRRLLSVVGSALIAVVSASFASAQTAPERVYPKQPVKLLVGFPPGGSVDIVARIVSEKLTVRLGQPFVVENRAGAGGMIAAEAAAKAAPDGHTLLVAPPSTCCVIPVVHTKVPYDPLDSFEYITVLARFPHLLTVSGESPHRSVADVLAWAKANPTKANYASASPFFQLLTELFKSKTGAPFEHIPYKGGSEMVPAILAGEVTMAFMDAGNVMGHLRSGKMRALATTGAQRFADLPDVPTLGEIGVAGIAVEGWVGIQAPRGMPKSIVDLLANEIAEILKLTDVRERLAQLGMSPGSGTPVEMRRDVERQLALWRNVAASTNIKRD